MQTRDMTTNTNATARAALIANRLPGPVDHYVPAATLAKARAARNPLAIMWVTPVCGAKARRSAVLSFTDNEAKTTCARCAAYLDNRGR